MAEQLFCKEKVGGSSPLGGSSKEKMEAFCRHFSLWTLEDLNAGADFIAIRICEAVPSPFASDGEQKSRGQVLWVALIYLLR